MILTVGGIKGGSGKTTLATNLAVMRALTGIDLLLIDADDQATSADFTALRCERRGGSAGYTCIQLADRAVRTETLRLRSKYQDIVIDVGGRDTAAQRAALAVSDILLVPFVPRSFDLWTLEAVAQVVSEMRLANVALRALVVLNRADARGPDNEVAAEYLRQCPELECLPVAIGNRKAFGNAAAEGAAVTELQVRDLKAIGEIIELYSRVFHP